MPAGARDGAAREVGGQSAPMNPGIGAERLSMTRVLACGAAIVALSLGIRHGFGLWLQPVTMERGWSREVFSFAIAMQNMAWGVAGLFMGMLADRFGAYRVLVGGGLMYATGLVSMTLSSTPMAFAASAGVLVGIAQAGTTYSVVYGVIGRNLDPARRSWAMGVTAAVGSFGQFLMVPIESGLISGYAIGPWQWPGLGWQGALLVLAAIVLLILPLARALREPGLESGATRPQQTIRAALREALGHRSFQLLTAGYFVCGFQVVFIGIHMPSYLKDHGLSPQLATTALALIGLFNVVGTYAAGALGQRLPKRYILSSIYLLRALAITLFVAAPPTAVSVCIFSAVMGLLWLSTVPPTNAVVAQIFGVQYLSTLGGVVFINHQLGSFLGVWLGGVLYDLNGNYDLVWWIAIALGVIAGLLNLPVRETPIVRAQARAA
jgi:MFS family permease